MNNSVKVMCWADMHYSDYNILKDEEYIESLCASINKNTTDKGIDLLVIAGDVCDKGGDANKYKAASNVIKTIMERTNIQKLLIVPGNHDVSRDRLSGIKGDEGIDRNNLWQYVEKYDYFIKLSKYLDVEFKMGNAIVCQEVLRDKYLFIGIDSNYMIGTEDGVGTVNISALKKELEEMKAEYGDLFDDLIKVVIMHHSPNYYMNKLETVDKNNQTKQNSIGNFELENWTKLKDIFDEYKVEIVLTGHVHGSQVNISSSANKDELLRYYSTIGSIGMNFNNELSEMLKTIKKDILNEKESKNYKQLESWMNEKKVMLSVSNRHNTYSLITLTPDEIIEQHYKYIMDEGQAKWVAWYDEPKSKVLGYGGSVGKNPFDVGENKKRKAEKRDEEEDIEKILMDIIRKEHLYKTGHFHWKDQCAMNWIDTSVLFTNSQYLTIITNAMINKYGQFLADAKHIVGVGIKGAILMSSIRYKYPDKKYTYYPENDENYNEFEKKILNKTQMDKIVVLTDVVHSGNTIKEFIDRNQDFIIGDNIVYILTIFLTGETRQLEPIVKKKDNSKMIETSVHELLKISVRDCEKKGMQCNVMKQKLDVVYEM